MCWGIVLTANMSYESLSDEKMVLFFPGHYLVEFLLVVIHPDLGSAGFVARDGHAGSRGTKAVREIVLESLVVDTEHVPDAGARNDLD